ncbi:hypothetical protein R3P38DRAFT_984441 [Favolaschia claudopus]|uniref:Uncharacterized protein n=1 Tax=Favolaschia claudopus TaxID=2862362 RepID=A0AAW0BKK8_9AGAR
MDDSPRPQKRARNTPPSDESPRKGPENQLHGAQLLLALPSLLVHPPTNGEHKRALHLSLLALRRCLGLQNPARDGKKTSSAAAGGSLDLSQPDECRAWCALAEIGLCIVEGGFADEPWAFGIEHEIEKALGKAKTVEQLISALVKAAFLLQHRNIKFPLISLHFTLFFPGWSPSSHTRFASGSLSRFSEETCF